MPCIFLKPDLAMIDGPIDLAGMRGADGTAQTVKGLFIAIMSQENGQWRFTAFWCKPVQAVAPAQ